MNEILARARQRWSAAAAECRASLAKAEQDYQRSRAAARRAAADAECPLADLASRMPDPSVAGDGYQNPNANRYRFVSEQEAEEDEPPAVRRRTR